MHTICPARSRYRRGGFAELLRLVARALDFVFLVRAASRSGALPPINTLREAILLELGPGPTKLRFLKQLMFSRVYYIDAQTYGDTGDGLRAMDLEELRSVSSLSSIVESVESVPLVLFADHCLEHLSRGTVDHVLTLVEEARAGCLIRVPNIYSERGRLNFERDSSHRTPFDRSHRRSLIESGLTVTPHSRWYRCAFGGFYRGSEADTELAEEVVISGYPSRKAGSPHDRG